MIVETKRPSNELYQEVAEFTKKIQFDRILFQQEASVSDLLINREIIGFSIVTDRANDYHLDIMGVIPSMRKKGFGKLMMFETLDRFKQINQKKTLSLGVVVVNVPAYKLYLEVGFKERTRIFSFSKKYE